MKKYLSATLATMLLALGQIAHADNVGINALSEAEKNAGWVLLFDGKSVNGWHSYQKSEVGAEWQVSDGVLSLTKGGGGDLITNTAYENFELSLQWKISPKGNSGIFFRVVETEKYPWLSGLEYQLLDNAHLPEEPIEQAASLFALYAPVKDVTLPTGEFNTARIVVNHGKVEHWLNGVKVVEYTIGSADFLARVAGSKFAKFPEFSVHKLGYIGLQDHGNPVYFRSIKIHPLPPG